MASVNRVLLIGIVASPPAKVGEASEFVLGVPTERSGRIWLERVRVVAMGELALTTLELRSAQAVYADGRIAYSRDGAVVQATSVFPLGDPPAQAPPTDEPTGTHASPRAHDRVGHPRRLHPGTPQERVIWVRPTRVGAAAEEPELRHRP